MNLNLFGELIQKNQVTEITQKPPFASMYLHTVAFYMHVVIEKNKQIYELHKTHLHGIFKLHRVASKICAFDTL